jgi:hypothetical protein
MFKRYETILVHSYSLKAFQWYQECEGGGCCGLEDFNVTIQKETNKTNKSLPSLIHGCFLYFNSLK